MFRKMHVVAMVLAASLPACAELQQAIDEANAAESAAADDVEETADDVETAAPDDPTPQRPRRAAPKPKAPDGSAFAGVFHVVTEDGNVTVVKLAVRGTKVTGSLAAFGIDAVVLADGEASGRIFDAATGVALGELAMVVGRDALLVDLATIDPSTGERADYPGLQFKRGAPPARTAAAPAPTRIAPAQPAEQPQPARKSQPAPSNSLHPDLIGVWKHTWQKVDPYLSVSGSVLVVFRADGTFSYGAGKAYGSDANQTIESSDWNPLNGQWRSTNGETIQAAWDNEGVWFDWATCLWVKGTLQLTYRNGAKERFYRQ